MGDLGRNMQLADEPQPALAHHFIASCVVRNGLRQRSSGMIGNKRCSCRHMWTYVMNHAHETERVSMTTRNQPQDSVALGKARESSITRMGDTSAALPVVALSWRLSASGGATSRPRFCVALDK